MGKRRVCVTMISARLDSFAEQGRDFLCPPPAAGDSLDNKHGRATVMGNTHENLDA
jgi:hypothetical protein